MPNATSTDTRLRTAKNSKPNRNQARPPFMTLTTIPPRYENMRANNEDRYLYNAAAKLTVRPLNTTASSTRAQAILTASGYRPTGRSAHYGNQPGNPLSVHMLTRTSPQASGRKMQTHAIIFDEGGTITTKLSITSSSIMARRQQTLPAKFTRIKSTARDIETGKNKPKTRSDDAARRNIPRHP